MKFRLLLLLALLLSTSLRAQQIERCGFGAVGKYLDSKEDSLSTRYKTDSLIDENELLIIPVVFHVIHNNGEENIPDETIHSQIDVLNEDFGRYGMGDNTFDLSRDAKIIFCLASTDPRGNPTPGINRLRSGYTDLTFNNELATKNLIRWDPRRYLNVWVVRSIEEDPNSSSVYLGYSYRAREAAGTIYDGIVLDYRAVGRNVPTNINLARLGRTLTHEMGHYLDLLHTWGGDGPGQGGCNDDDGIDDTPLCDGPHQASRNIFGECPAPFQCGNLRLVEDYMDYSEDVCMHTFTNGQITAMRQAIFKYRPELYISSDRRFADHRYITSCGEVYTRLSLGNADTMTLLPSLANDHIYIYPNFSTPQEMKINIYDIRGRAVEQKQLSGVALQKVKIELMNYRKGMYIMVAQTSEKTFVQKFIVSGSGGK